MLAATVKIVFWAAGRFYARTQAYDQTRLMAGSTRFTPKASWSSSYEPREKLDVFQ